MGKELTYLDLSRQRQTLGKILPLKMPLSIQFQITNLCNFKCYYCNASQSIEDRMNDGILLKHMPFEDYKTCIDSIKRSGGTKVLNLVGWGEPLLHPDIVNIVRYAKEASVAKLVRIVSNGSLLTHEMSDALIDAGLDNIRISLQGTCQEDYRTTSGVHIDFEKFVENIEYYYNHRQQSRISLKIMDVALEGKEEEFQQIFSGICNEYLVDSLVEISDNIDLHGHGSALDKAFLGTSFLDTSICSVPFYRGFIDVDSRLFPCCHIPRPYTFGDVRENFYDVWNGVEHIIFLLDILNNRCGKYPGCQKCKMYLNQLTPAEKLDDYRDALIPKYEALLASAK